MDQIISALQTALVTIVIAIIGAAATIAATYINKLAQKATAETKKIDDENTRELAEKAIERISNVAYNTVMSFQQELVPVIKAGIEDGTYTRDDLLALRDKAVEVVMTGVSDDLKNAAMSQISDLEKYVQNLVSSYVLIVKAQGNQNNC